MLSNRLETSILASAMGDAMGQVFKQDDPDIKTLENSSILKQRAAELAKLLRTAELLAAF